MGPLSFLQGNLNHCAQAQDLLVQSVAQWSIDVAVVAEPYRVLQRDGWYGDADASVALLVGLSILGSRRVFQDSGFVAVSLDALVVVGVYFSPNRPLAEFETFLARLGVFLGRQSRPVLVAGDLNAKSLLWGSPGTCRRGETLEEWVTALGLVVANRGSTNTCVRQRGGSIVDITLASPAVFRRLRGWRVVEGVESLSDHRYIRFCVVSHSAPVSAQVGASGPRWALGGLNREALLEASIVYSWGSLPVDVDAEAGAEFLCGAMTQICDASMPRVKEGRRRRRQACWWRPELQQLRETCVAARRWYTRLRGRRVRREEEEAVAYEAYRDARRTLRDAIRQAKTDSWHDFVGTLESDPWGRPYKWVRQKLRPAAPPLTQSLNPRLRESVISTLFPSRAWWSPPGMATREESSEPESEVPPVTSAELQVAVQKMRLKNTAPGLDGIPGRVWALAMGQLEEHVLAVLTACLSQGRVPQTWKTGKLVLLRKDGRPEDSPSAYRPIVLLDEACKILERIIALRLNRHLEDVGPNLSESQHGFRAGRSTIGAIARLRAIVEEEVARGGVVLAVSLDISNAFNSLPWETINEALKYHEVPLYLRRVISDYLSDRAVRYPTRDGWGTREVVCGVPQGSALGPILWSIGYDWALRGSMLRGASVLCYADDTLVVNRSGTHRGAAILATASVAQMVRRIRALGLEVALHKSEAVLFHGPRNAPPPGMAIIVGGTRIEVRGTLSYLGLTLDSRWNFQTHFRRVAVKVAKTAACLSWLLPNVGGPSMGCRRLYMGVVRSMALYGAPIWAESLSPANRRTLARLQRTLAIRAIRGYRTVSGDAACVLSGSVPWDLDALTLSDIYHRGAGVREEGDILMPETIRRWSREARERATVLWQERLQQSRASPNLLAAIRPIFREWIGRSSGTLTFRLTQVLTGHGCFGRYLCEVAGREETTACHHCCAGVDDSRHTVVDCPAWEEQRSQLAALVGADLSLPALIQAMLREESAWQAVAAFAEEVILRKEEAERVREILTTDPRRQRRRRRRGANTASPSAADT